jgi:MFS family permease
MSEALFSRLHLLRNRNFSFYLFARVLGTLAVQMQSVAIGWQVYDLTRNPYDLGLIGLAQFAPFLALILIAGHVADRYERRRIILICFAAQLVCAGLLYLLTFAGLKAVWPVFAVLVLFGSARAFLMPANQAILINLVPRESFSQAVALSSSCFQIAVISGPVLGGFLYLAGPKAVYGTVAGLLLAAVILMSFTRTLGGRQEKREPATLSSLFDGLRFVRSNPAVLGAMSLDLFAVLFGGATALLPALARDVLHAGPTALGFMRMAPGIGSALTSLLLAFHPITRRVGLWMFGGVAVFGIGTIVLGSSPWLPLSLAALALMGAGDMVSVYIRHLLVQLQTPDSIRGRVSAVNSVFIGASNELGEFESGITAGWFGVVPAVMLGGAMTLAVVGIWTAAFPVLRNMERFPKPVNES